MKSASVDVGTHFPCTKETVGLLPRLAHNSRVAQLEVPPRARIGEPGRILFVEDETSTRDAVARMLRNRGYEVSIVGDGTEAIRALANESFDLLVADLHLPGADGLRVVEHAREVAPETVVLLVTGHASIETAIAALRTGVADYIQKPIAFGDLVHRITKLLENREAARDQQAQRRRANLPEEVLSRFFVGRNPAMRRIFELVAHVAPTDSTVLVTGESGVGKEVVARAIHQMSRLGDRPFLAINCAAIPESLLESQLFGHRKGSFTGADHASEGLFRSAEGGTIFLDEIGEMPAGLQAKLLRAIAEKEILPIGAGQPVQITVRIIASTNRNLREAVEAGLFREDLYYRLNVFGIEIPPLRDRREDIPFLIERLLSRGNVRLGRQYKGVTNEAMTVLLSQPWKGNVRELDHVLEYAMVLGDGEWIRTKDLPARVSPNGARAETASDPEALADAVRSFERAHIENVLHRAGQDRRLAADRLRIHLATLYRKIHELGIDS